LVKTIYHRHIAGYIGKINKEEANLTSSKQKWDSTAFFLALSKGWDSNPHKKRQKLPIWVIVLIAGISTLLGLMIFYFLFFAFF